jgi:hypothetical protein
MVHRVRTASALLLSGLANSAELSLNGRTRSAWPRAHGRPCGPGGPAHHQAMPGIGPIGPMKVGHVRCQSVSNRPRSTPGMMARGGLFASVPGRVALITPPPTVSGRLPAKHPGADRADSRALLAARTSRCRGRPCSVGSGARSTTADRHTDRGGRPCPNSRLPGARNHKGLTESFKDNPNRLSQTPCRAWNTLLPAASHHKVGGL